MAKVIEDIVVIKLSRIVKDHDDVSVLDDEAKALLSNTIPQLVEEILNDRSVIVELANLE